MNQWQTTFFQAVIGDTDTYESNCHPCSGRATFSVIELVYWWADTEVVRKAQSPLRNEHGKQEQLGTPSSITSHPFFLGREAEMPKRSSANSLLPKDSPLFPLYLGPDDKAGVLLLNWTETHRFAVWWAKDPFKAEEVRWSHKARVLNFPESGPIFVLWMPLGREMMQTNENLPFLLTRLW